MTGGIAILTELFVGRGRTGHWLEQVRNRLSAGEKQIRTLSPRYMDDAFENLLVAWLGFAFLPERPTRSQGRTDGSNPLSSAGESVSSGPRPRTISVPFKVHL